LEGDFEQRGVKKIKREEIKVCILRVGGTNCDLETQRAFQELGVQAKTLHVNELIKKRNLLDFQVLVIPGGFSYGDYVRAGVILARLLSAKLDKEIENFVEDKRAILGICNGFQVLVEYGLLPGFEGISPYPEATLTTNIPQGYNCRWVHVKQENRNKCKFTNKIPYGTILSLPIAHSEGRFLFPREQQEKLIDKLYENDMIVFRYCTEEGDFAEKKYPANPNGSLKDIAGISNSEGNIFGLMPHPERAFYCWQKPDWTKHNDSSIYGDGKLIFESIISNLI
jgi:phosphoribosylformylglycinamidine synthase